MYQQWSSYASKFYSEAFWTTWIYSIYLKDFVNWNLLFCIALLIFWIWKNFWTVQNALNLPKLAKNHTRWVQNLFHYMLPSILSCKTFIWEQVLLWFTYFYDIKHSKSDCFSCQNTEVNFWVPMQNYVLLAL